MGIVVHSYGYRWNSKAGSQKYPGFADAIDLLDHCQQLGGGGIQVGVHNWSTEFVKKFRARREKLGLYLEGSISMPGNESDLGRFEQDLSGAKEAGASVLRTVCSSGRRYEVLHTRDAFDEAQRRAITSLQLVEPILHKHKVKLAVENHKDWRATELAAMIKQLGSEWIGVTLDFGNSISLMEDPMEVVETLAPIAFATHVKDMGVDEYVDGFLLSEVPLGKGILDLSKAVATCKKHNPGITFNLEMITRDPLKIPCLTDDYWATFNGLSGQILAKTLRMVKQKKYPSALPTVSQLTDEGRLAVEEENIIACLAYGKAQLGL